MNPYFEKFTIRWSDMDANRHLANASYMNFCSQTRMQFLMKHNYSFEQLIKQNIGPIIMKEVFSFYKEFLFHNTVFVGIEIKGKSEDGSLFHFHQRMYNEKGEHCASSDVYGAWFDLHHRKITIPSDDLKKVLDSINTENIEILSLEDLKQKSEKPEPIDISLFENF